MSQATFANDVDPDAPEDTPSDMEALVKSLMARIGAMEKKQQQLIAAQPKPVSMVDAALKNLGAHVEARGNQSSSIDFGEVRGVLGKIEKKLGDGGKLVEADASRVKLAIENLAPWFQQYELHYLPILARDFHKAILDDIDNGSTEDAPVKVKKKDKGAKAGSMPTPTPEIAPVEDDDTEE